MEIVRDIVLFGHLLGMASLLGGAVVQMRGRDRLVNPAMFHGAVTQVVSGVLLVGIAYALDDGAEGADVDNAKIAVKAVVAVDRARAVLGQPQAADRERGGVLRDPRTHAAQRRGGGVLAMSLQPTLAPVDPDLLRRSLEPLGTATMLPAVAYTSPDVLAWERRQLFAGTWSCVGRDEDLRAPRLRPERPVTQRAVRVGDIGVLLTWSPSDDGATDDRCARSRTPAATAGTSCCPPGTPATGRA